MATVIYPSYLLYRANLRDMNGLSEKEDYVKQRYRRTRTSVSEVVFETYDDPNYLLPKIIYGLKHFPISESLAKQKYLLSKEGIYRRYYDYSEIPIHHVETFLPFKLFLDSSQQPDIRYISFTEYDGEVDFPEYVYGHDEKVDYHNNVKDNEIYLKKPYIGVIFDDDPSHVNYICFDLFRKGHKEVCKQKTSYVFSAGCTYEKMYLEFFKIKFKKFAIYKWCDILWELRFKGEKEEYLPKMDSDPEHGCSSIDFYDF